MPLLEKRELYIHKVISNKHKYNFDQKMIDLISIASAPGIGSSNSIYKRIHRRIENENGHALKKTEKLRRFKMNSFDEHLFCASQQNRGLLIQKTIEDYAKQAFTSDELRKSFLDYAKIRLGYLSYLGLLNDTSEGNRYSKENITLLEGEVRKEQTVKVRLGYRYEVNTIFYRYYLEYRKEKEKRLKEQFEFGSFDAYIYNYIRKNNGTIDLGLLQKEKVDQAMEAAGRILHQVDLMLGLGYLFEKQPGHYQLQNGIQEKLKNGQLILNTAEKQVMEFIKIHGVLSLDKYKIEREIEAQSYAEILKTRLEKLITLGFMTKNRNQYSFTSDGERRLKAYYAETYEFKSFDRNILNNHKDGIVDLNEFKTELETRYGETAATDTLERQQERIFIMECAGMVRNTGDGLYTLANKSLYILEEENHIFAEERRELLKNTFKYSEQDEEFYKLIMAKGGTLHPKNEIQAIMDALDPKEDMKEIDAYNMLMRNYNCLGAVNIDAADETKTKVKLGYIVQNKDVTLSLTVKGKRLVNALNTKEGDLKHKALSNKKFRLLCDIDKNFNRLDPKIYLKTQKIIADKELRKTVNLLRYRTENLYLLGMLTKNEDGSYTATEAYEKLSTQFHEQKLEEEVQSFKLSNVHKFILKFCRDNQFNMETYREYISKKIAGISLEREMKWKRSSLEKMTRLGYFEHTAENIYSLTEKGIQELLQIRQSDKDIKREKAIREFKPGTGYKNLLKYAKEGVLDFQDVEKRVQQYNKAIQQKELSIKKMMLQKLITAGFLESITAEVVHGDRNRAEGETSLFRLTSKALDFMVDKLEDERKESTSEITLPGINANVTGTAKENQPTEPTCTDNDMYRAKPAEIKITKFDVDNIISLSGNGFLSKAASEQLSKKPSVLKRINTLCSAGFMAIEPEGWRLTDELLERSKVREVINHKREKTHYPKLDLDCLTAEQKKTLTDLKDFLNLTGSQILKYIYNRNEILYKGDIRYLVEKGILRKDSVYDVYVLTKKGTKLASDLTGDHHIFGSKLDSRREEIKHDVLVYTAYKDMEKQLINEKKIITSVKTDRMLRSEDMRQKDKMSGEYPDLRIEYEDKTTGVKSFANIEVDVGYSEKVIEQKLKIPNLLWYTNSEKQREKVMKKARYMPVKVINEKYWR